MVRTLSIAAFLTASALGGFSPASSQTASELAAELAAMRAHVEALEARLAQLETGPEAPPAAAPTATTEAVPAGPLWRGAPTLTAPGGWSFKPRGRLQFDAGSVSAPAGISDAGLGFSNEVRRARLGVEGTVPGGFGYKFEVDFAGETVEIADALTSFKASQRIELIVGQHNNFQSLEELTSSRFSSFVERAAFTDAFNFERRVGLSAGYANGPFRANVGIFTDNIADLDNDENNSIGVDGRVVYAPKLGETQLHFGGSAHFRDGGDLAAAGATTRYRQRPLIHSTDTRFLATPALPVEEETSYGLEAAVIRGPFHAVAEMHRLSTGTTNPALSPAFTGGYAEIGYYLTGETRGYRNGLFDRTRVLRPVGGGGAGAFQINVRYDHVDLTYDGVIGGRQDGYQASLIWIPTDYVRFLLNYAHLRYDDAAIPAAGSNRDYGVDVVGARAQIDF